MAETLNLVNPNDPLSLKYRVDKFPDGQQNVTLLNTGLHLFKNKDNTITIKSRLNTFLDLEVIIAATQALREIGVERIRLFVPYFIGARSDRKFSVGGVNYLKSVIAPIINSQGYEKVIVLDPHSDVLEAVINNFEKSTIDSNLILLSLRMIDNKVGARERTVFISPDAGAMKRVYDWAERYEVESLLVGEKIRDIKTGQILHTKINGLENYSEEHNFVMIDDICDGGRTFIELAKKIREVHPNAKISLIVTHSIFSAGLKPFDGIIDKIYTTNSYQDIKLNKEFYETNEKYINNVEQLNVF